LHHQYQEGERVVIRGYRGNTEYGQVVVNTGSQYDIGFKRQTDGTFNVCTDWWGVQGNTAIRQETFLQQVNQNYARGMVLAQAQEQGLIVEEEKVLQNGEVEIVLAQTL
jgi:hypothetical protein